jgi:hypothetical protein
MMQHKLMMSLAIIAASLATAATAGATARVRVTGGTSVRGRTTGFTTFSNLSGRQTINCPPPGSTFQTSLRERTTAASYPATISHRFKLRFTSCFLAVFNAPIIVTCLPAKWAVSGITTGAGLTPGFIQGIVCDLRANGATSTCHVRLSGSLGTNYTNTNHLLAFDSVHSTLTATGSPSGCFLKDSSSTRFTTSRGFTVSPSITISAT